jgi:hypothetical protein
MNKNLNEARNGQLPSVLIVEILVFTLLLSGCAHTEARYDSFKLRDTAIAYYQDQIMDNLARARNGQLFLHVNLTNLNTQITSKLAGTANGGQSLANTGSRQVTSKRATVPQIVSTISSVATRPFTFSVNPERDDQITVTGVPQYTDPFVYDMYLRFLALSVPGPLIFNGSLTDKGGTDTIPDVSDSKKINSVRERQKDEILTEGGTVRDQKEDGTTHYVPGTLHRFANKDYYVPIEYKQAYFDLCVAILGRVVTAPTSEKSGTGRKTLYISPPASDSLINQNLRDIKNQIQNSPPIP